VSGVERSLRKLFRCLDVSDLDSSVRILAVLLRERRPIPLITLVELVGLTYSRIASIVKYLESLGVIESDIMKLPRPGRPRKIVWVKEEGLYQLVDTCIYELTALRQSLEHTTGTQEDRTVYHKMTYTQ